jgi:bromodomain-containing factor 1
MRGYGGSLNSAAPRGKAAAPKDPRRYENEMNFCRKVLTELKRKKYTPDNQWFLAPVPDIPGYRDVIQYPMDMSTMEKKISSKQYNSAEEFREDMKLMFNNCYT